MFSVTKKYRNLPAAHRQPDHKGHCRFIHGHNWGFDITFYSSQLDDCGFVIDLGALEPVKEFLTYTFDHTTLLNESDPLVTDDKASYVLGHFADVRAVPNCGMEGLAEYVFRQIDIMCLTGKLGHSTAVRHLRVKLVTCYEDSKNSANYQL